MHINNFKIKNKLLLLFPLIFIPLIIFANIIVYNQLKYIFQTEIENELKNMTGAVVNLIRTSASVSIKNRLRAIAEKNLDIATFYYSRYQSGHISRAEALKRIELVFLSQKIGKNGYISCIDINGYVQVHPTEGMKGTDISHKDFVKIQLKKRQGYIEDLCSKNENIHDDARAHYMVFFKPLGWIISVSACSREFNHLIDIDDFKNSVLSCKFGRSGYAFMLSETGEAIIHPKLSKVNLLKSPIYPSDIAQKIIEMKQGKLTYFWKNPDENNAREKIVHFDYLPEFGWYVASSSYIEEIFKPLATLKKILIILMSIIILISVIIIFVVGRCLTSPLDALVNKLKTCVKGNYPAAIKRCETNEVGQLTRYFNFFTTRLENEILRHNDTQEALKKSELKFRTIFNHSFQLSAVLTPSGLIEDMNRTALNFSGLKFEDIAWKPFWECPWQNHDGNSRARLIDAIARASRGEIIRYETLAVSKKDKLRNIDFSIIPIFDDNGEVLFLMPEARDITDFKKTEEEKRTLEKQLFQSQKMEAIGTLAGGIAHDFNNILCSIFGFCQLAKIHLNKDSEKVPRDIDNVCKCAQKASALVNQILTIGRKSKTQKRPLNFFIILKETIKFVRATIPSSIIIKEKILCKKMIIADSTKMHQVIMNLLINAYHAMQDTHSRGILSITLDETDFLKPERIGNKEILPGKYLHLKISDTGHGIPSDIQCRIFEPYFTTKALGKGTGLGLAVVDGIVSEHQGVIDLSSTPGKGTEFSIFFPIFEDRIQDIRHNIPDLPLTGGTEHIMLVDDEKSICTATREFLQNYGYEVSTFANGTEAYRAFRKNPDGFDLVITDLTMPEMTGDLLSSAIISIRPDTPIILFSGYRDKIDKLSSVESCTQAFINKPVESKQLLVLIRQFLDADKTKEKNKNTISHLTQHPESIPESSTEGLKE